MWDEVAYPLPNFNGATVEVWEWISNFIQHFTGHVITHPWWDSNWSMSINGAPCQHLMPYHSAKVNIIIQIDIAFNPLGGNNSPSQKLHSFNYERKHCYFRIQIFNGHLLFSVWKYIITVISVTMLIPGNTYITPSRPQITKCNTFLWDTLCNKYTNTRSRWLLASSLWHCHHCYYDYHYHYNTVLTTIISRSMSIFCPSVFVFFIIYPLYFVPPHSL